MVDGFNSATLGMHKSPVLYFNGLQLHSYRVVQDLIHQQYLIMIFMGLLGILLTRETFNRCFKSFKGEMTGVTQFIQPLYSP